MKIKERFFPLLISLVLLVALGFGSTTVNAAESTNSSRYANELEQLDLTEEQIKMVELTQKHLKASKDSNGNVKLEIINSDEFVKKIKELGYPINMSEIQNVINNYTESLTPSSEDSNEGTFTPFANVHVGGGGGTIDTSKMSCGDALSIIGLIHSGSYSYAAYLLGITGGIAVGIPFIIAAAYTVSAILCD